MQRILYILAIACLVSLSCFGQDTRDKYSYHGRKGAAGDTSCISYYTSLARKDIAANEAKLLARGGIAWNLTKQDAAFEKAYGVRYNISGCVLLEDIRCIEIYNKAIFTHLDAKYGSKWRKKVRTDVIGL